MKESERKEIEEKIKKNLKQAHVGAVIEGALKSENSDVQIEARGARNKIGLEQVVAEGITEQGWAGMSEAEREEAVKLGFQKSVLNAQSTSYNTLRKKAKDIFQTEKGYDERLANIGADQRIIANADKADLELIRKYQEFDSYREIAKELKAGKTLRREEEGQLRKIISEGVYEERYKKALSEGKNETLAQIEGRLASLVAGANSNNGEVLQKGAEKVAKKAEEDLKRYVGGDKNYKQKVAKYVAAALTKMLKSEKQEDELTALSLYNKVLTGYELGGQTFHEVFKKEN